MQYAVRIKKAKSDNVVIVIIYYSIHTEQRLGMTIAFNIRFESQLDSETFNLSATYYHTLSDHGQKRCIFASLSRRKITDRFSDFVT